MDHNDHIAGVGAIVTNLQALETSLRFFLGRRYDQHLEFPKPGDAAARQSYLTAFAPLGELIEDFNKSLKPEEEHFKMSFEAVRVRDALAHGRLVVPEPPSWPATLWKFGKVKDGRMPVEFCQELTVEWMKDQYVKIERQHQNVINCFAARGYKGLSK
jgi:hypothetical protein